MSKTTDTEIENRALLASAGESLTQSGLMYGIKTGYWLSIIYAVIGQIVVTLVWQKSLFTFVFIFIVGILPVFLLAIFPAMFYGTITGIILGLLIERLKKKISRYPYIALCMLVCVGIAIISHLIFGLFWGIYPVLSFESIGEYSEFNPYDSYLFWIGLPTVIYIITGGCVGWRLFSEMLIKTSEIGKAKSAA